MMLINQKPTTYHMRLLRKKCKNNNKIQGESQTITYSLDRHFQLLHQLIANSSREKIQSLICKRKKTQYVFNLKVLGVIEYSSKLLHNMSVFFRFFLWGQQTDKIDWNLSLKKVVVASKTLDSDISMAIVALVGSVRRFSGTLLSSCLHILVLGTYHHFQKGVGMADHLAVIAILYFHTLDTFCTHPSIEKQGCDDPSNNFHL